MEVLRIQLDEPIQVGEETKTELVFDFDRLTGRDVAKANKIAQTKAGVGSTDMFNPVGMPIRIAIAAVAAGVPYERLLDLPGRKFNQIMLAALAFCAGGDSISAEDLRDSL